MQIVVVGPAATPYAFEPVEEELKRRGHEVIRYIGAAPFLAQLDALAKADILYGTGFPCTRALLETAPQLRAVVSPWIGVEGVDIAAASELGIVVANGQVPENYLSVAEATIMVILACLQNFPERMAALRANQPPPSRMHARMLRGKTVGMIGFGNMARAIVHRLSTWDVVLQAYAPRRHEPVPANVAFVALDDLLRSSDVVCVLAALNAETRHMLNEEKLRLMKPDAVLVHTSRGGIVDEAALVRVAKDGHLYKIALDVFETEPLSPDSALRELPNAILTPHCVGHSREGAEAVPRAGIANIERALAGEPPLYVLNPAILPEWQRRWGKR
ncbi:MAG TPA: NAD(P)-dependent oxidoreductase [Stellaceae bacterium]|jgi:phosphoglycerate dehydrogenase-like enzyme|nr:NAD(P)-dependent oxidoreductase [Stellaceae bacterium]